MGVVSGVAVGVASGVAAGVASGVAAGVAGGPPIDGAPRKQSSNRALTVTLVVSLALHAAAVIAVLLLLRSGVPVADGPERPTEVELVMEEHKGDARPAAAPSPPAPQAQKPLRTEPTPAEPAPPEETGATEPAPDAARTATPAQTAEERRPDRQTTPESPAAAQPALTISLQGTDSPSNAKAFGDRVVPASSDAVFHNRPPEYPEEAARNGEAGTVMLLIHVSPVGTAVSVDLVRSSGHLLLDSAAREAVMRWRFLPAVKDGRPIASEMTMGFVFDNK